MANNSKEVNTVLKAFTQSGEKLTQKAIKATENLVNKAQIECQAVANVTGRSIFKTIFDEYYGMTYNIDSLFNSITIVVNNFNCDIKINLDIFQWHHVADLDGNFNRNESSIDSLSSFRTKLDDIDEMGKVRSFFIDASGVDLESKKDSDSLSLSYDNLSNANKNRLLDSEIKINKSNLTKNNNGALAGMASRPVADAYTVAKDRALAEIEKIIKDILRKYGLFSFVNK